MKKSASQIEREEAARAEAEARRDRVIAGLPAEATIDLDPDEIATLEAERAQMNEDAAVVKAITAKPKTPREFAAARLAGSRATGRLDPAVVQAKLDETAAALAAKEAELARQAEDDRKAAEQREVERQALRLQVGQAQVEQAAVRQDQVGASLAERVAGLKAAAAANRQGESTDESAARAQWIEQAKPLVKVIEAFLLELEDWLAAHGDTLRELGKVTWETTPATWHVSHRTRYADRAAGPARQLLADAMGEQAGGMDALARFDQVVKKVTPPTGASMERIVNASKYHMYNLTSALGALDTALERVEAQGKQSIKGDRIPTVTVTSRGPITPRELPASVTTSFDVHAPTKQ